MAVVLVLGNAQASSGFELGALVIGAGAEANERVDEFIKSLGLKDKHITPKLAVLLCWL